MFHEGKVIFTGIENAEKPHPIHFWQYSINVLNKNVTDIVAWINELMLQYDITPEQPSQNQQSSGGGMGGG